MFNGNVPGSDKRYMTKIYKISGMHCSSCALSIEWALEDAGIKAKCNYAKAELRVENADDKKVKEIVEKEGYKIN